MSDVRGYLFSDDEPSRIWTPEQRERRALSIEPVMAHVLPVVSVVVVSYNNPEHLEKCLESVYQQVYPCWELIVTDDGSDPVAPVERLATKYGARFVTHPHTYDADGHPMPHISRTLNAGLQLASGHLVQTLQQDHVLAPDFLLWLVRCHTPRTLMWGLTDHRTAPLSLFDIQMMVPTLHLPDGEVRYANHLVQGRALLAEMTDWRNTDGLDCAFEREGAVLFDEDVAMTGQGHCWLDWVLTNVVGRGARLLINPMMRLWHLEHPERPDRDRWQAQIDRSYAYMQAKWKASSGAPDIWNSYARPALYNVRAFYEDGDNAAAP